MFRQKQDADQSRIRLPRRSMPPTKDYLEFAFTQAFQYRDKEVEISWTDTGSSKLYNLVVRAEPEKNHPFWTLSEESNEGSQFLWSGETSDLQAIEKKIEILDPIAKNITDTAPGSYTQPRSESPYRNMFSGSYHGIVPPTPNSLRESFTRIPPLYASSRGTSSNNNPTVAYTSTNSQQRQPVTAETSASALAAIQDLARSVAPQAPVGEELIRRDAPALSIRRGIIEGLASIATLSVYAVSNTCVTGSLEQTNVQNKHLMKLLALNKVSGKLNLVNQMQGSGEIFFEEGTSYSASVTCLEGVNEKIIGDEAIVEMLLWTGSSFRFSIDEHAPSSDVSNDLETIINYALSLRDQLVHLEKAALGPQSLMVKKIDNLGDNELRLLLTKNSEEDPTEIIKHYKNVPKRFTIKQLFENQMPSKLVWVPVIFNLFTSGLIDIRAPLAVDESSLEFLGEVKIAVQGLRAGFIRQETGIFSYPALLFFLQYEYLRYQANDSPLSLIVFEMSKVSNSPLGGLDLINKQETLVALRKIAAIKRPLDILGHFETIDYALLLPDTGADAAIPVAQHVMDVVKAQPLSPDLKPEFLKLSCAVGSIPRDGRDLETLILLSKRALQHAKNSDFTIVQAGSMA